MPPMLFVSAPTSISQTEEAPALPQQQPRLQLRKHPQLQPRSLLPAARFQRQHQCAWKRLPLFQLVHWAVSMTPVQLLGVLRVTIIVCVVLSMTSLVLPEPASLLPALILSPCSMPPMPHARASLPLRRRRRTPMLAQMIRPLPPRLHQTHPQAQLRLLLLRLQRIHPRLRLRSQRPAARSPLRLQSVWRKLQPFLLVP